MNGRNILVKFPKIEVFVYFEQSDNELIIVKMTMCICFLKILW